MEKPTDTAGAIALFNAEFERVRAAREKREDVDENAPRCTWCILLRTPCVACRMEYESYLQSK